ncbi:hypothetical protein COCON_G00102350 [Conger conger]|uniref:Uncharacterized protein n=1 Tax=Conger conger TaxID=82655 RepID=A0A9Q1HXI0_CONCO|nr:hypothetical protein COCON_G00102350 [Conger conger]
MSFDKEMGWFLSIHHGIKTRRKIKVFVTMVYICWTVNGATQTTPRPRRIIGIVFIFIRLVFNTINPVPTESEIRAMVHALFVAHLRPMNAPVRVQRSVPQLNDPVAEQDITYEKLSTHSFALELAYRITNVSMPKNTGLRNETCKLIQDPVNKLLNEMLNERGAKPFTFPNAACTTPSNTDNQMKATVEYVYREGDINQPNQFLTAVLNASGLAPTTTTTAAPTTTSSAVLILITEAKARFPGWALAIIIPCGIAIIILPFWILLFCQLCGCCVAIKRRWRRMRAYHIQEYRPHPV